MSVTDKTILFGKNEDDVENRHAAMVLEEVFAALKEAGHNPVIRLELRYLVSGEPTYITSLHDARKIISGIERDELVEEIVRFYVKHQKALIMRIMSLGRRVSDYRGGGKRSFWMDGPGC